MIGLGVGITQVAARRRASAASSATLMPRAAAKVLTLRVKDMTSPGTDGTAISTWTDTTNGYAATASAVAPTYYAGGGDPYLLWDGTTGPLQLGRPAALATAIDSGAYTAIYVLEAVQTSSFGPVFCADIGNNILHAANGALAGVGVATSGLKTNGGMPWTSTTDMLVLGVSKDASAPGGHDKVRTYFQGGCVTPQGQEATTSTASSAAGMFAIGATYTNTQKGKFRIKEVHFWNVTLTPAEHIQALKAIFEPRGKAMPWVGQPFYLVGVGSSIISGQDPAATFQQYMHIQRLAAKANLPYGAWSICSYGGGTIQSTSLPSRVANDVYPIPGLVGIPCKAIYMEWYNSQSIATILADTVSYCAGIRSHGFKLLFDTMTDYTSSHGTDSAPVTRAQYCAYDWVAAGAADAVIPIHTSTLFGVPGSADANPTQYYSDGLHMSETGYDNLSTFELPYVLAA